MRTAKLAHAHGAHQPMREDRVAAATRQAHQREAAPTEAVGTPSRSAEDVEQDTGLLKIGGVKPP